MSDEQVEIYRTMDPKTFIGLITDSVFYDLYNHKCVEQDDQDIFNSRIRGIISNAVSEQIDKIKIDARRKAILINFDPEIDFVVSTKEV